MQLSVFRLMYAAYTCTIVHGNKNDGFIATICTGKIR